MRIVVSSGVAKGFTNFLRESMKLGFTEIELVADHVTEKNLRIIDRLSKMSISSIRGNIKNYKYFLYLAQSLNCDFLSFDVSGQDKRKLTKIIRDAKNMGVSIAIENHSKEEGFPCTPKDMKKFVDIGASVVLDTAKAKTVAKDLSSFTKLLKDEIVGFRVSDFYKGFGHLPIGMGELVYLEPVLKEFGRTKIQMIINLKEAYNLIDAWISKENLKKYYKGLPKS